MVQIFVVCEQEEVFESRFEFVRGHVKRVAGGWKSRSACIEVKFAEYHMLRPIDV